MQKQKCGDSCGCDALREEIKNKLAVAVVVVFALWALWMVGNMLYDAGKKAGIVQGQSEIAEEYTSKYIFLSKESYKSPVYYSDGSVCYNGKCDPKRITTYLDSGTYYPTGGGWNLVK